MSEKNPYGSPTVASPPADPGAPSENRLQQALASFTVDAAVVVAWFAVAAIIGAAIWAKVTPLPEFTRTAENATMDEAQLAKQVSTDGWFLTLAAVGGLVSGFALLLLRRRSPVLMVLLVAAGGALATKLMVEFGLAFGPADPSSVLAGVPVGASVPVRIRLDAHGLYLVWSIAALAGALVALWGRESREARRTRADLPLFQGSATG